MLHKILMPSGGQTTDELTLVKWNKTVGEMIRKGDILFEVETDKAILSVESFAEGKLLRTLHPEGALVKTGELVALIGNDEDLSGEEEVVEASSPGAEQTMPLPEKQTSSERRLQGNYDKIPASPLAKNFARIEKISLDDVGQFTSTRPIKRNDVQRYLAQRRQPMKHDSSDEYELLALDAMRRTIAKRMKESVHTAPHYIVTVDVDMEATISLRDKINSKQVNGAKISYNDIIMKAVAVAAIAAPMINARFDEDGIRLFKNVHIGLAVATPTGIIVPVTPEVNRKSLSEIAAVNASNIEKVKNNRISEEELKGGTITISNLGMFGVNSFTAIINQPESCILAIGAIMKNAIVIKDELMVRNQITINGSFDHRVIDGAVAAGFLKQVKELLEEPGLLSY